MKIKKTLSLAVALLMAVLAATLVDGATPNGLRRMYVLDCGRLIARDQGPPRLR